MRLQCAALRNQAQLMKMVVDCRAHDDHFYTSILWQLDQDTDLKVRSAELEVRLDYHGDMYNQTQQILMPYFLLL